MNLFNFKSQYGDNLQLQSKWCTQFNFSTICNSAGILIMNKIISWQQQSHLNKISLNSKQGLQEEATRPQIYPEISFMFTMKWIYLHLNTKLWTKGLWDSVKPWLNCLWSSGIVEQARFCTAGHKHSCLHCTTCIWFSRDIWVRSNPGALGWHARPCVFEEKHLQETVIFP